MGRSRVLMGARRAMVSIMLGAALLVGCSSDGGDEASPDAGSDETTVPATVDEPDSTDGEPSSSGTSIVEEEQPEAESAVPSDLGSWTWVRSEAAEVGLPEDGEAFEVTASSFGDGMFVTSGYRQRSGESDGFIEGPMIWTSVDGGSWSSVDMTGAEAGEGLYSVAHGSAGFVAVGEVTVDAIGAPPGGAGVAWISADGQAWARHTPDEWASFVPRSVTPTADGGYLAAGATSRFQASLWKSADGVTWTEVAVFDESAGIGLQDVAGGPSGYVAVGRRGEGEDARAFVAWSTDALSWEDVSGDQEVFPSNSTALEAVVGGDRFLVAGRDSRSNTTAALWSSSDGVAWQRWPVPATDSLVYVGDLVAVPGSSIIMLTGALADGEQPSIQSGAVWQVNPVDGIPTPELLDLSDVSLGTGVWNAAADATFLVAFGRDSEDATNRRDFVVWTAAAQ